MKVDNRAKIALWHASKIQKSPTTYREAIVN
jgi:hypothetical protein